jgi:hypothetical protein
VATAKESRVVGVLFADTVAVVFAPNLPLVAITDVAEVAVPALPSMLTPARDKDPVPRLRATAVVPIYTLEFPSVAEGIVPVVRLDALSVDEDVRYVFESDVRFPEASTFTNPAVFAERAPIFVREELTTPEPRVVPVNTDVPLM